VFLQSGIIFFGILKYWQNKCYIKKPGSVCTYN
jgi:hypothetical protein